MSATTKPAMLAERCDACGGQFYHRAGCTVESVTPPVDDIAILREYRAAQQSAIDEVFGLAAPADETSIAQLAVIIREDPIRAATRWLNLEAQVKIMRAHQETFEIRLLALRDIR